MASTETLRITPVQEHPLTRQTVFFNADQMIKQFKGVFNREELKAYRKELHVLTGIEYGGYEIKYKDGRKKTALRESLEIKELKIERCVSICTSVTFRNHTTSLGTIAFQDKSDAGKPIDSTNTQLALDGARGMLTALISLAQKI